MQDLKSKMKILINEVYAPRQKLAENGVLDLTNILSYRQKSDSEYEVEINIYGAYECYLELRNKVNSIFVESGFELFNENDLNGEALRHKKKLIFVNSEYLKALRKTEIETAQTQKINTQFNAPVIVNRDLNTGRDTHIENIANESNDEKWFQKEIVKMVLSFIGGVAATIVAQLIIKTLGILQ